ncbi:MAG: extracellular solute-binding protein [Solirubrobacterales bacterium]|nr:extracellular solute-binding protein [Solirubrobacterales bacterium]
MKGVIVSRRGSATRTGSLLAALAIVAAVALSACGSGGGESAVAAAPDDPDAPATGTLRMFTYGDTAPDQMLDPFREQNPDLDLKAATFNSNKAAAAKLAGGFEADVVEVCTDEMSPLIVRDLLRPLDPKGVANFNKLAFSDADEVRDEAGHVLFAPASAGPHGLIVNTDEVPEREAQSYQALFDPAYAGNAALEATPLTAIAVAALALGLDDPMNLSDAEVEQAKQYLIDHRDQFRAFADSDASMVNLFKSGEAVIADGGRGTAQAMIDDGLPVKWIAPEEGALSWVCGLAITSHAQNLDAAYKLINYYASPEAQAISAKLGYVAMNPDALELLPKRYHESADPRNLETAIPETEPDNAEAYDRAWQEVQAQ